jgi:hypothetical protein
MRARATLQRSERERVPQMSSEQDRGTKQVGSLFATKEKEKDEKII